MQLDPGNVVAARLLADSYLDLGDRLDAIKKYKLVRALLPNDDEELEAIIARLDRELNAPPPSPAPFITDSEPAPLPETEVVPETEKLNPATVNEVPTPTSRLPPTVNATAVVPLAVLAGLADWLFQLDIFVRLALLCAMTGVFLWVGYTLRNSAASGTGGSGEYGHDGRSLRQAGFAGQSARDL